MAIIKATGQARAACAGVSMQPQVKRSNAASSLIPRDTPFRSINLILLPSPRFCSRAAIFNVASSPLKLVFSVSPSGGREEPPCAEMAALSNL